MKAWEEFLISQEQELGAETSQKWLRSLKVLHFDACNLYLEAQDSFQLMWFEEHIRPKVVKSLTNSNNHKIKVHLNLSESSLTAPTETPQAEEEIYATLRDPLDPTSTFENFIPTETQHLPLKLLEDLSGFDRETGDTVPRKLDLAQFNPIYLYGPSGVGKSHLLMAATSSLIKQGLKALYVHSDTFTEQLVKAIRIGKMIDFRKSYREIDVLIFDDVDHLAKKTATQEEFFHTFNTLHTSGRQIILSAKRLPSFIDGMEPRLISRFEWGITLPLQKLSSEELKEVIAHRCSIHKIALSPKAVDFLEETFKRNTQSLYLAIDALALRIQLERKTGRGLKSNSIDIDQVNHYLRDLIEQESKDAIDAQRLIKIVADIYGIKTTDILGKSHIKIFSQARQMAMHLSRKFLELPYTEIGRIFSRDHSTVISSVKAIESKIATQEKEAVSIISEIERRLESS